MSNFYWISDDFCIDLDKITYIDFDPVILVEKRPDNEFVKFKMRIVGEIEDLNNAGSALWTCKKSAVLALKNKLKELSEIIK